MITERVDDIPLILAKFQRDDLASLLTEHFPNHGNWQGVDGGAVAVIFLTYVLSCADHRTSYVETWADQRIHTLRHCTGLPNLTAKDLTDDKLGSILDKYSDDEQWRKFEAAHNQNIIKVYDLDFIKHPIRLDAMITQSHREAQGDFQLGYSKQHRSDLPQIKTMLATVDPHAVPLVSLSVAGNQADDGLYLPVIRELDETLPLKGQLFVGDSKMSSLDNRSDIEARSHYYLTPLSKKQCSTEQLEAYLADRPTELQVLQTQDKQGNMILKAKAFEKIEILNNPEGELTWEERRIVVYSPNYAISQKNNFARKLEKASQELDLLSQPKQGRRKPKTREELKQTVQKILKTYKVTDFIDIEIIEKITKKEVRAHLDRAAETRIHTSFDLKYQINPAAQQKHINRMGWRVFACNAPIQKLNTLDAVQCYRNEYRIEHKFDELLNRVTALMPVYLSKPNRIKALIRLLLLALKYVSLIEMQVRKQLTDTKQTLKELYPGNPGRKTDKPTTKMLLKAFEYITLVVVSVGDQTIIKITDLKPIQLKILDLLKLKPETYLNLNQMFFSKIDFPET